MPTKAEDKAKHKRESLQLQRLTRIIDVIYAIVIWRIFILIGNGNSVILAEKSYPS